MSGIIVLKQPGVIYTLVDGASYTPDGILTNITAKTAPLPDIRMSIFTQGPAGAAHLAAIAFYEQFASFDEFAADSAEHVRKFYFDNEAWMRRGGRPELVFYFTGYSDKRSRPEGYMIRCAFDDNAFAHDSGRKKNFKLKPFVRHTIADDLSVSPGIFSKADLVAAKFPTHLAPKFLDPETDMLHIMEMIRRKPCSFYPGDPDRIMVGGCALLTRIDEFTITQKVLAEYPDAIGEPMMAPAPLDYARWRAGREFRRKLTTHANGNRATI
jgi:hypothetical protein